MGFYYVDLEPVGNETSQQYGKINLLFPSSIVGEIFVEGKIFSAEELKKAVKTAEDQCVERLTKIGGKNFANMSIVPAREIIESELKKIDVSQKYRVVEKNESLKNVEKTTKGMGNISK